MDEYISKEFMLKNLEADKMNNAEHCEPVTVQIMERFIRYVKEFPSADVQPIRRGRWIGINEYCKKNGYIPSGMGIYYWCSECEKEEPKISDYCPNCGARMDLKDGDTDA